jgi:hypothetical protein
MSNHPLSKGGRMFTEDEKKLLKLLVKKEIKEFELKEMRVIDESPSELTVEEKYDEFLKRLLDKL